jgi:cytochrome P450
LRIIADDKSFFQVKSNSAEDLPQDQRISDEDILNNINTFMFAGSDTSSLAVTWTLYLLAQNPDIQGRLLRELLGISPQTAADELTDEEIRSLYDNISNLSYLHNVTRESLRLIPPVHSSIRVATQDDEIPTAYPVHRKDGSMHCKKSVTITKGTLVHVAIEGFNLDKEIWGDDAWDFKLRFRTLLVRDFLTK